MAQAAIAQGNAYNNNNKQRIIKQGFRTGGGTTAANKEGFGGMLGPNAAMDDLNAYDRSQTMDRAIGLNVNVAQYGTDYAGLTTKTNEYINDAANTTNTTNTEKNYNVFINKSQSQSQITDTIQQGCVTATSVSSLSLSSDFSAAYPANFLNYAAAKDACKLWAADSGKTVFAINKDSVGKYQCSTGTTLPTALQQYTVPKTLYTVLTGKSTSAQGGLFSNGQIGVYNSAGNNNVGAVGPVAWNIQNMTAATLLRKYNSNDYSGGPAQKMGDPGWGTAGGGYWGQNVFPNDKNAWWISIDNVNLYGIMGYFYYVYYSPAAKNINIYMVIDDNGSLKLNGTDLGITPQSTGNKVTLNNVHLIAGKNVFEFKLINTGGPGAFVFYASGTDNTILFRSGDPGWAVSTNAVSGFDLVTNSSLNPAIPYDIMTVNSVPAGYSKCDPLIGGGINKSSINANFGRNCSNQTLPPVNIRYIKIRANPQGECLQIAQVVVNSLVNGVITNVAPRGTTSAPDTYANGAGGSNKDRPIDGLSGTARAYPNIYHSACSANSWWQLDLGKDYPVTEIIYANRADCCSSRAIGTTMTATSSSNTQYGPVTLTGAMVQSFNISAGGFVASS
jgi:hypothetical protein